MTAQPSYDARIYRPRPSTPPQAPPAPPKPDQVMTVKEVAALLRVSKMTVYRLIHGAELNGYRIGRNFRIPTSAVKTYMGRAATDRDIA